ncbi:MAG TPA: HAD family hydrolase [Pyrinomonadaceae bacterium]|nr:HAD family hydrolase [Pyrinomonadaceae bacterium]
MKRPAVFLDRDGTLIEEVNFLSRVEDLRLFPFTADAVRLLKDSGYLVIVVTNQSGIGRGIYTEDDMHAIHAQIQVELDNAIDAFYFCPHLPDGGCECRKPGLGMIESALANFDIDLERSWMVGDKKIDVETGIIGNMLTALVLTGYGAEHQATFEIQPTLISTDLHDAVKSILSTKSNGSI